MMNVHDRERLRSILHERRDAVADRWYDAVAGAGFVPISADTARRRLGGLLDRVIALLLDEPVERLEARALGAALAEMRYIHTEVVGRTLDALATPLLAGLPAAQALVLYPRLVTLCGELAIGYATRARAILLAEQEELRAAGETARRRAEDDLWASEARFRAIFEDAAVGITLVDMAERRTLLGNPALARMLGYEQDELYNLLFSAVTHPDDEPASMTLYRELAAGRRDHYQLEKRYVRKDGGMIWGRLTVSLVRDPSGGAVFSIGMIEDITVRKLAETELAEAHRQMLDNCDESRLHLARELHDGPVQDLHGAALHLELLKAYVRDPAGLEQVSVAQEALRQAAETVRAVCHELRPPALAPFGLAAELRTHVARFGEAHPEMNVCAELAPDGQALPEVTRLALLRVCQEALSNVARHAHAARVRVRFAVDAEGALLEIADDGRGFAVPDRLTALIHGGHLGLVGAMERAATIGGRLEVTSAPGRGTTVRVVVPGVTEDCPDG